MSNSSSELIAIYKYLTDKCKDIKKEIYDKLMEELADEIVSTGISDIYINEDIYDKLKYKGYRFTESNHHIEVIIEKGNSLKIFIDPQSIVSIEKFIINSDMITYADYIQFEPEDRNCHYYYNML